MVNVSTKDDDTKAKLSIQKTKWESTNSKQKNQRPKSMKLQLPFISTRYNSFNESNSTDENVIKDP